MCLIDKYMNGMWLHDSSDVMQLLNTITIQKRIRNGRPAAGIVACRVMDLKNKLSNVDPNWERNRVRRVCGIRKVWRGEAGQIEGATLMN